MRRIAIDWDGTCIEDYTWPGMGDWLPGAVSALRKLAMSYDEVVIWTLRTAPVEPDEVTPRNPSDQYIAIGKMLTQAALPWNVKVWDRPYKPPADFYVDNKAVHFRGDWPLALLELRGRSNGNAAREEAEFLKNLREETPVEKITVKRYRDPVMYPSPPHPGAMRQFETGATRNAEVDPDYHGFFSPLAMHAYGEYMHAHRLQADGTLRESDNWQKGMPQDAYVRSLVRHTHDVQLIFDGYPELARQDPRDPDALKAHLSALIFNAQGLLHEISKS